MGEEPTGDAETTTQPGSAGSGLGGVKDTGPDAGAGPGGPEDRRVPPWSDDQSLDGPSGSQDSSAGDLDEAGG